MLLFISLFFIVFPLCLFKNYSSYSYVKKLLIYLTIFKDFNVFKFITDNFYVGNFNSKLLHFKRCVFFYLNTTLFNTFRFVMDGFMSLGKHNFISAINIFSYSIIGIVKVNRKIGFACQSEIPGIYQSLNKPSERRFKKSTHLSFLIVFIIYFAIGISGFVNYYGQAYFSSFYIDFKFNHK